MNTSKMITIARIAKALWTNRQLASELVSMMISGDMTKESAQSGKCMQSPVICDYKGFSRDCVTSKN